jgi:hypothetical protein
MIPQGSAGTSQPWLHMNTAAICVATIAKKRRELGIWRFPKGTACAHHKQHEMTASDELQEHHCL